MLKIRILMVFYLFFVSKFVKNYFYSVNCDFLRVFLHFFGALNTDFDGDLFISKNVQNLLVILENRYSSGGLQALPVAFTAPRFPV